MSCQTWTSVTVQLQGINVNTFVSTLWVATRAHAKLDTSYKWTGSCAKVNHMYNIPKVRQSLVNNQRLGNLVPGVFKGKKPGDEVEG